MTKVSRENLTKTIVIFSNNFYFKNEANKNEREREGGRRGGIQCTHFLAASVNK